MAMEAGAAAAAVTGAGMGLFSYNRGNYMFDQKNHYTRFTAGLNMAIAQTGMYKQDIAQMTELTVARQDCYHGIAAMGLTILTAIYCPGRVGFHEPAPPSWLMGLEFVNIAGCYLFLGLTIWFAMHAAMRADTAATHMLTRFVRLPIPSQEMLDKARKFLASYEEQPLKEVFRIPFMSHQKKSGGSQGGYNEAREIDDEARGRTRHGYDVPAWYRKEKHIDNSYENESINTMMPLDAQGTAPEHFEAYRELQMEWFPYDVYARLSIFLGFMHLTHCWAYLQICYLFTEVRAMWACAIVIWQMFILQQVILTLDIIPNGIPVHRVGPFGLIFAYFAAFIEYKRWYSPEVQTIGFVLVYCAYACHIIYTLQLYRLCAPSDEAPVVAETPGASWWPGEWKLPSAFSHAIWLVAPPKKLEGDQVDLMAELRDAQTVPSSQSGAFDAAARRMDVHRALGKEGESPAWFSVKVGLLALCISWIWLTCGFTYEVLNQGTTHPNLLSAPGMPNNARDPRYRPAKPGTSEPTEVGTGGVFHGPAKGVHMASMHRRLSDVVAVPMAIDRKVVVSKLREILPLLNDLASEGAPYAAALPDAPAHTAVQWPAMFQPSTMACGPKAAVALSRHGRGAHFFPGSEEAATPFALHGAAGHGVVLSAAWDAHGLLVATTSGTVLECAGEGPVNSRWACQPVSGERLPIEGGARVALTRAGGAMRAAVLYPGDDAVVMFSRTADKWRIQGEVRALASAVAAAFAGERLILQSADGAVSEMHLADGSLTQVSEANAGYDGHIWSSACRTEQSGDLLRLAVSRQSGELAKLIIG